MDGKNEGSALNQSQNDFLARLGLDTDPFPVEADSSFYYENPDLMQRLDMIQHLIGFSNQMIFITGEQGIGKTSMLDRLEYYAPDHWRICRIQANPMLNTPILLRQLTSGFELDISADADDMFQVYSEALQDHIETLERAMLTPVVLIDDAHELPVDAFTMLFGFMQQEGGHSRLKMALFCEPQIIAMLDSPQLKSLSQNLTHQLEIPAFDEHQTGEYIEQRLNHAGLTGDFPFLPETIQKIYRNSQGIAGKIHTLAQQALLDENAQIGQGEGLEANNNDIQALPVVDEVLDFNEDTEEVFPAMATQQEKTGHKLPIGRKFHTWQIGAVAAVLALLAGVLWLTSQFSDDSEPAIAEEIPLDITPEPVESPTQQSADQDPTLFEESTTPEQIATETTTEEQATHDPASQEPSSVPETSADPLEELVQSMKENEDDLSGSDDIAHQHEEVTVQIDENGKAQIVEVNQTASARPESPATMAEPVQEAIPEITSEPVIAAVEQITEPPVTRVQPEPVKPVRSEPATGNLSISGVKDGAWLRTQSDSQILLQLLGTHDQQALKKILKENPMGDDIAWFTTVHDGEPWYVVVKGPFKDRAAATASIASLPADMKKRKPWPRTVASVKKAMDEAP